MINKAGGLHKPLLLKIFLHLHFIKGLSRKKSEAKGEEPVTPPYNILKYTL